jgi:hypothetical protein
MHTDLKDTNRSDLETLMLAAQKGAEATLQKCDDVMPVFTGLTPSGSFVVPSEDFQTDEDKDAFSFFIRILCIAAGAVAGVLTMESWVVLPRPGERLDLGVRASLHPRRREALFISGQALGGIYAHRALPILRDAGGKFAGFEPAEALAPKPTLGRFARLLPDRAPSDEESEAAVKALTTIGVRMPSAPG